MYNGDKVALIYKDLEQIDEAILLQKGNKNKRLEYTQDEAQLGFVTPDEVANIGQNVRKYIDEYGKPFEDSYTGRVYEWQDENGVKFRLVVKNLKEVGSGNSNLPSANEEIITFCSNRNLKDDTKKHISQKEWFKNPAVAERYKEKVYYGGYTEYGISGSAYNDMRYKGTRPLQYFTQDDLNFFKEKLGLKKITRKDFENFLLEKGAAIEKDKNSEYYGEHTWHHINKPKDLEFRYFLDGDEAFFYSPEDAILKSKSSDIKKFFGEIPKDFEKNKKKISEDLKARFTQNENVYKDIWYGQKMRKELAEGKTESEAERLAKEYVEKNLNWQKSKIDKAVKNEQKRLKNLETRRKNKEIENKAFEYITRTKKLQSKSFNMLQTQTADKIAIKQMIDEIDNFLNEKTAFFENEGKKEAWREYKLSWLQKNRDELEKAMREKAILENKNISRLYVNETDIPRTDFAGFEFSNTSGMDKLRDEVLVKEQSSINTQKPTKNDGDKPDIDEDKPSGPSGPRM